MGFIGHHKDMDKPLTGRLRYSRPGGLSGLFIGHYQGLLWYSKGLDRELKRC